MDTSKQTLRVSILWVNVLNWKEMPTEMINAAWGDHSVSASTVKRWFRKFRDGNSCLRDHPRPGAEKQCRGQRTSSFIRWKFLSNRKRTSRIVGSNFTSNFSSIESKGKDPKEGKMDSSSANQSEQKSKSRHVHEFTLLVQKKNNSYTKSSREMQKHILIQSSHQHLLHNQIFMARKCYCVPGGVG